MTTLGAKECDAQGDFATADEAMAILHEWSSPCTGILWDPVNSLVGNGEQPAQGAGRLGSAIRHIHVKDFRHSPDGVQHVLTGEGVFRRSKSFHCLKQLQNDCLVSFEWEKKWYPKLEDAAIAVPHFAEWFRRESIHG